MGEIGMLRLCGWAALIMEWVLRFLVPVFLGLIAIFGAWCIIVFVCVCLDRRNTETAQMRYKVALLIMAGWLEKGVLTEGDLIEIQAAIDAQYVVEEPDTVEDIDEPAVN